MSSKMSFVPKLLLENFSSDIIKSQTERRSNDEKNRLKNYNKNKQIHYPIGHGSRNYDGKFNMLFFHASA